GKEIFNHGFTFGGHPMACAVALANIDVIEDEQLCAHVLENEGKLRATLDGLRELPIVGDVRGAGYFQAIELVKDQQTKETFNSEESEHLLRGFLSGALYDQGLICRTDDRGDPIVELTVESLIAELGLELASGHEAAQAHVRWVHSTELADPTPWLRGGELLLTTGLQLSG